ERSTAFKSLTLRLCASAALRSVFRSAALGSERFLGILWLLPRVVDHHFVDRQLDFLVARGLQEEEQVVDLVSGGKGPVGTVVTFRVFREVEVGKGPGVLFQVRQADVAVV